MNIGFQIAYRTVWGECVTVEMTWTTKTGTESREVIELSTSDGEVWRGETAVPTDATEVGYAYFIVHDGETTRREWTGLPRSITMPKGIHRLQCTDRWRDKPGDTYLYTSAFT